MKAFRLIGGFLLSGMLAYYCMHPGEVQAQAAKAPERSIRAIGRSQTTVTTDKVHFGDLASIQSRLLKDDESVIALKKIVIEPAPAPGEKITISAARVLERLREEGVNPAELGYSLPKIMSVNRASRVVLKSELEQAIQEALKNTGRDIKVKDIEYSTPFHIAPGEARFEAIPSGVSDQGRLAFQLIAKVASQPDARFEVQVQTDEWIEVPVASRPLSKGAVVSNADVMMARLNVSALPQDAAYKSDSVLGYEIKQGIRYGEVFRKNKLSIPPLIETGSKVTMVYESGLLRATASGVALEDGIEGQQIRIRNDSSRRIVVGTVLESGVVGVKP